MQKTGFRPRPFDKVPEATVKTPIINSIRQLRTELEISNDDLRDILMLIMGKLSTVDLKYALITMETEYDKRRWENAA